MGQEDFLVSSASLHCWGHLSYLQSQPLGNSWIKQESNPCPPPPLFSITLLIRLCNDRLAPLVSLLISPPFSALPWYHNLKGTGHRVWYVVRVVPGVYWATAEYQLWCFMGTDLFDPHMNLTRQVLLLSRIIQQSRARTLSLNPDLSRVIPGKLLSLLCLSWEMEILESL